MSYAPICKYCIQPSDPCIPQYNGSTYTCPLHTPRPKTQAEAEAVISTLLSGLRAVRTLSLEYHYHKITKVATTALGQVEDPIKTEGGPSHPPSDTDRK